MQEIDEDFEEFLLDELTWEGMGKRGRKKKSPPAEIVRGLGKEDLDMIAESEALPQKYSLQKIRESHHALARALAKGMSYVEASAVTGYSPQNVQILINDPAFCDLLATYSGQEDVEHANIVGRLRTVGLSALDELQERLDTDPVGWTKRELMEMSKLGLIDVGAKVGGTAVSGAKMENTLNIKFVQSNGSGTVIDIRPDEINPSLELHGQDFGNE